MTPSPRVFISYSHDSAEHAARVLALADRLRSEGIDARLDRDVAAEPPEGWTRWQQRQIEAADFVLVICTPRFRHRLDDKEASAHDRGAAWEALLAGPLLGGENINKLVPVLLDDDDEEAIPLALRPHTRFRLPADDEALYRRLTGQPAVTAPSVEPLAPIKPRSSGIPDVIELPGQEQPATQTRDARQEAPQGRAPAAAAAVQTGPMRLQRFKVSGYKNFRQPIELDQAGAVNVIHGENNVGKSNLLQAMDLFMGILGWQGSDSSGLSSRSDRPLPEHTLQSIGYSAAEIFNLESPQSIDMVGAFSVSDDDLSAAELALPPGTRGTELQIGLQLGRNPTLYVRFHTLCLLERGTGRSILTANDDSLARLAVRMSRNWLAQEQRVVNRFVLIGTDRHLGHKPHPPAEEEPGHGLIPDSLLLSLYDAKESLEPLRYRRWELFVEAMRAFEDIVGTGQLVVLFNRHKHRANLALQTDKARIPIGVHGSGVQQLVALLAHCLMSDATIVAIEEPELNLRFDLQRRLRDVLQKIVDSPAGPSQIFLTSHSPAFESGACFYAMRATESGPVLERRRVEDAAHFTTHVLEGHRPGAGAPLSYVSSEGLVQLPDAIRKQLDIERGGGIVILRRAHMPYVELLTNEQFLALMNSAQQAEQDDDHK